MFTLNVPLSEELRQFVEEQAASGGYDTPGEFVQTLIRAARERAAQERLEELLIEGLDSGPPIEGTPEYWAQKRARVVER